MTVRGGRKVALCGRTPERDALVKGFAVCVSKDLSPHEDPERVITQGVDIIRMRRKCPVA